MAMQHERKEDCRARRPGSGHGQVHETQKGDVYLRKRKGVEASGTRNEGGPCELRKDGRGKRMRLARSRLLFKKRLDDWKHESGQQQLSLVSRQKRSGSVEELTITKGDGGGRANRKRFWIHVEPKEISTKVEGSRRRATNRVVSDKGASAR